MKKVHANSKTTYRVLRARLSGIRRKVFDNVIRRGPATDRAIASRMRRDYHQVQPRISDLISDGYLGEVGQALGRVSKKPVRVVGGLL